MVTKKNSRSPWAWIPTLYFAEGLPNVIVTALSVVMYMQLGLTDAEVGLYTGWLALPWVIKPLWSPFIDLLKTKRWWVLTMQALIGAALLASPSRCLPPSGFRQRCASSSSSPSVVLPTTFRQMVST